MEEDLFTRLENLPRPELLAFLLRVEEAGSTEVSCTFQLSRRKLQHWIVGLLSLIVVFMEIALALNDTLGYFNIECSWGNEEILHWGNSQHN